MNEMICFSMVGNIALFPTGIWSWTIYMHKLNPPCTAVPWATSPPFSHSPTKGVVGAVYRLELGVSIPAATWPLAGTARGTGSLK